MQDDLVEILKNERAMVRDLLQSDGVARRFIKMLLDETIGTLRTGEHAIEDISRQNTLYQLYRELDHDHLLRREQELLAQIQEES